MSYCDESADLARQQQPRIFAEASTGSMTKSQSNAWREFSSEDDWAAAGKSVPVALVWNRDGAFSLVTIVSRSPHVRLAAVTNRRVDYGYGRDAKLIRIRAVPFAPQQCELLFPCRLISGHEFFLGGQRPAITDWVFTTQGTIRKLRNGKEMSDYFDPSNSLTVSDLQLRTSDDLPFDRMASQK